MRFRIPWLVPPGGKWFYLDPDTGRYAESRDGARDLLRTVNAVRTQNGFTPVTELDLERYLCTQVPVGFCLPEEGEPAAPQPPGGGQVSLWSVYENLNSTRVKEVCPLHEAERRAVICRGCPSNDLARCTTCNGLRQQASARVRGRRTKLDDFLGVCVEYVLPCNLVVHRADVAPCPRW
jgi:hypothetical protein